MQYKIVRNEGRKTVTVIIAPVTIGYVDYLYKKYEDERYFASGVLSGANYNKEIMPFANNVANALNEINKDILPAGTFFTAQDIVSLKDDEFRLINRNLDKEKNWDKQFKLNLSSKSNEEGKAFLFKDLAQTQPIPKADGWKHNYAVEIEIGAGYNEDEMDKYVYSVFHRGVSIGLRKSDTFVKNDEAWGGFNLEVKPVDDIDDDVPF